MAPATIRIPNLDSIVLVYVTGGVLEADRFSLFL